MNATFYNFKKRKNSTLRPNVNGSNLNVVLKESSSILSPRLELTIQNPANLNYVYIPSFDRYYFINDWISDHGLWIANCSVDVLASWRDSILNTSQYVTRSASKRDSYIIDGLYPMTDKINYNYINIATKETNPFSTIRYIVGVSNGNSANKVGGCTYYNLSYGEFSNIMNKLLGSSNYLGDFTLDGISDSLVKALVNPLQYIGETYILPYNIGDNTVDLLSCGWWPIDASYAYHILTNNKILDKHEIWRKDNIHLANHPQTSQGFYTNCSPYSQHILYAGPFGIIQLPSTELANCSRIDLVVNGDFKGNIELEVHGWTMINDILTDVLIDKKNANCSIPISISQIKSDVISGLGLAGNIVGSVQTTLTANPVGLVANISNGLKSAEDYFIPHSEGGSAVGSFDDILESWDILSIFRNTTEIAPNIYGQPLCNDVFLNELNGFTQIDQPILSLNCYDSEYDEIIAHMRNGFFIDT